MADFKNLWAICPKELIVNTSAERSEAGKWIVLGLYAVSNDKASTKEFAQHLGINFDEERIYRIVSCIYDIQTEKKLREWWDTNRQEAFDKKLSLYLDALVLLEKIPEQTGKWP